MSIDPALTLARHIRNTGYEQLPEDAVVAAKRDILDTLGVAVAGSGAPGIGTLANLARKWGGSPEGSLLVLGGDVPAPQAAMVNGAMGHALDFDDTFDRAGHIHPGTSVLAASLAIAESLAKTEPPGTAEFPARVEHPATVEAVGKVSGKAFLLAVSLGLDVSCRLALAAPVDRGWHRTAAFGVFGATAAAGKLLNLSVEQLVNAFGIAYSQAAGNRQCIVDGALTKRLQAGQAAHAGVLAAILAKEGFTGAKDVFTGQYGFFPMYAPERHDLSAIDQDLGSVFRGVELSFKPYPCGRPTHALIDAAIALHHDLELEKIKPIWAKLELNQATYMAQFSPESKPGSTKARPETQVEAQFSLPYLISASLCLGKLGIGEVTVMDNPQVLALAESITGEPQSESIGSGMSLEVARADGRSAKRTATTPSGSPEKPLTFAQLEAKFRDCAAHAAATISELNVERTIDFIHGLDEELDAVKLVELVMGRE